MPSFKIGKLEAVGRRLKRNYVFIFAIIMVAWTMKVLIHAQEPIHSIGQFYRALAVQEMPAWMAAIIYFGTIIAITGLTFFVARTSSEEVGEFGVGQGSLWRI